jgi:prophage maintenance system killer protein
MFWVKIDDFEAICYSLACELFTYNQPIPPFRTRFPGVLESSLASPLQTSQKGDLYPKLIRKISFLFYLMIKNHPFLNGNKRMAVATLLVTLFGNRMWIKIPPYNLYKLAAEVSNSDPKLKDTYINKIEGFLMTNIYRIKLP